MTICNNSTLTYRVFLTPTDAPVAVKTLAPQQRLKLTDFFTETIARAGAGVSSAIAEPRNYHIAVYQGEKHVRDCALPATDVYVALLGPKPHVIIYLDSEEAREAYKESLRELEKHPRAYPAEMEAALRLMLERKGLSSATNNYTKFKILFCYNPEYFKWDPVRISQIWCAFKHIVGEDPATPMQENFLIKLLLEDKEPYVI